MSHNLQGSKDRHAYTSHLIYCIDGGIHHHKHLVHCHSYEYIIIIFFQDEIISSQPTNVRM